MRSKSVSYKCLFVFHICICSTYIMYSSFFCFSAQPLRKNTRLCWLDTGKLSGMVMGCIHVYISVAVSSNGVQIWWTKHQTPLSRGFNLECINNVSLVRPRAQSTDFLDAERILGAHQWNTPHFESLIAHLCTFHDYTSIHNVGLLFFISATAILVGEPQ